VQVDAENDTPQPRTAGRPLDPEVDRAILAAAGEILVRDGFQDLTLPRVAVAAGVAKSTVYRRYPNSIELVLATINHLNLDEPAPDTGSARDDLVAVLDFARLRFDLSITGTLLTEERERPELLESARRQMIIPAIDRFRQVLGRSPIRYLTEWRMHLAEELLATTDIGVVAVAHRVGYESEEAFSRAFKRARGLSPSHWRDAHTTPAARTA